MLSEYRKLALRKRNQPGDIRARLIRRYFTGGIRTVAKRTRPRGHSILGLFREGSFVEFATAEAENCCFPFRRRISWRVLPCAVFVFSV